MQMGYHADVSAAVVGDDSLPVELGERSYFPKRGNAAKDHALGLQDLVDVLFAHLDEFAEPGVVFAARNGNLDSAAQFGELLEGMPEHRLLKPVAIEALKFPSGLDSAFEVPLHAGLPVSVRLSLIGIDHDFHTVTDRGSDRLDGADVFSKTLVVYSDLDRFPALLHEPRREVSPLPGCRQHNQARVRNYPVFATALSL